MTTSDINLLLDICEKRLARSNIVYISDETLLWLKDEINIHKSYKTRSEMREYMSKYILNKLSSVENKLEIRDRIGGMIILHAIGDALGTPFEFGNGQYNGNLEILVRHNRFQGTKRGVLGQVSDDTEMAFALAYSMKNVVKYDKPTAISEYMKWANSGCPFMGKNTRALLHGVTTIKGYETRKSKLDLSTAESNGCLMRAYPLSCIDLKFVEIDCSITNPAKIAIQSCELYTLALKSVLKGSSKQHVHRVCMIYIEKMDENNPVRIAYKQALEDIEYAVDPLTTTSIRDISINRGWVVHAIYCTFWAFTHFDDPKMAIDRVILHSTKGRTRGDTDTNACIAGALMGAYYGFDSIRSKFGDIFDNVLKCDTKLGDIPRSDCYQLKDSFVDIWNILLEAYTNN